MIPHVFLWINSLNLHLNKERHNAHKMKAGLTIKMVAFKIFKEHLTVIDFALRINY
jgi:hypothetical protein